jgi:hypothetical protein
MVRVGVAALKELDRVPGTIPTHSAEIVTVKPMASPHPQLTAGIAAFQAEDYPTPLPISNKPARIWGAMAGCKPKAGWCGPM